MTPKQELFCLEYLKDLHGTQAYRRAGYKAEGCFATSGATRLLNNVAVAQQIQKLMDERAERAGVTADRVLTEIAKLAFFDPRKFFDADGAPIPIHELDDDTAAALAGMDVLEVFEGTGKARVFVGYTKKYKLTDKRGSLELLGKHLKLFTDVVELKDHSAMSARLQAARARTTLKE
jgi:phage terminase small subunit